MSYKYMTPSQMKSYFEQALFRETLIGKGKFRIVTKDNFIHDRLYILDRIIDFATIGNIKKIQEGIYGVMDELIKDDEAPNLLLFIWAFLLDLEGKYESTKKFTKIFNYDPDFLAKKIFPYLNSKSQLFIENEEERRSLLLVCSKLPQLAEKLGFSKIDIIEDDQGLYVKEIKTKPKKNA
jgi:hypothetical protein